MNPSPPLSKLDLDLVLSETRGLWDEVRGQQVFITGGTGFFGCWLVETFCHINRELALEARATVLTRDPGKFAAKCPHLASDPTITLHTGDVRHFEFPVGEFRYVIHAATETTVQQVPLDLLSTIIEGTERTLEFAAQSGAKKFLLTSSGAVYGPQPATLSHLPETYVGEPGSANVYAEGKRIAEQLCALYQQSAEGKGFEAKIVRCWAFAGPYLPLDAHFAIGNFIGDVLAGRAISIGGDGTPRRSYLYAADLAIWLWTILLRGPALVPINVGSGTDVSILELAECVARTLSPGTEIRVAKAAVHGALPTRYVPSVKRAESLLRLRETVQLEEAIRRMAAWERSR